MQEFSQSERSVPPSVQTLQDAYRIMRRHRKKSLVAFASIMGLFVLLLVFLPRKYSSEAKLFVQVGRQSVGLDPTATPNKTPAMQAPRETEIQSILDVMQSRAVFEQAVDLLGHNTMLKKSSASDQNRAKAVKSLQDAIDVSGGRHSRVITVTCRSRSPELAKKLLEGYLDAFHVKHLQANRTSKSYDFFATQTSLLQEQLREASTELRDAKNDIDLVSIEGERKHIEQHKGMLQTQITTARSELAAVEAAIVAEARLLDELPQRMLTQEVSRLPDDPFGATRKRLFELRIRERELLAKYTERHPLVVSVRAQVNQAEEILAAQSTPSGPQTNAVNPTYQQLSVKLLNNKAMAFSFKAKLDSLNTQYEKLQVQLRNLNEHEALILRLRQRVELSRTSFATYAEKLEQARLDRALEAERISNVNVFQSPNLNKKPVFPKKAFSLLMGLIASTFGGIATAFFSEYIGLFVKLPPQPPSDATFVEQRPQLSKDPMENVRIVTQLVDKTVL